MINNLITIRFLSKPWTNMPCLRIASRLILPWLKKNNIPHYINGKHVYFNLPDNYNIYTCICIEICQFIDINSSTICETLELLYILYGRKLLIHMDLLTYDEAAILYAITHSHLQILQFVKFDTNDIRSLL